MTVAEANSLLDRLNDRHYVRFRRAVIDRRVRGGVRAATGLKTRLTIEAARSWLAGRKVPLAPFRRCVAVLRGLNHIFLDVSVIS
jgi:hypothetical protein